MPYEVDLPYLTSVHLPPDGDPYNNYYHGGEPYYNGPPVGVGSGGSGTATGYVPPPAVPVPGSPGSTGSTGHYVSFRFIRSASQPSNPEAVVAPTGWYDAPPAGSNFLWFSRAVISAAGVLVSSWTTPVRIDGSDVTVEYSVNGTTGWTDVYTAGMKFMRVKLGTGDWSDAMLFVGEDADWTNYVFQRSATAPDTPILDMVTPTGWYDAPPSGDDPLWMSMAYFTADDHLTGVWSAPVRLDADNLQVNYSVNGTTGWHTTFASGDLFMRTKLGNGSWSDGFRIVGETGADGDDGATGHYISFIFIRSVSAPSTPSGLSPAGWSDSPPGAGTGVIWVSTATISSAGSLLTVWSTPAQLQGDSMTVEFSADGSTGWTATFTTGHLYMRQKIGNGSWSDVVRIVGEDGSDGLHQAVVLIWRRAATGTPPALPSVTATYTFATNGIASLNNSWQDTPPAANGQPLWVSRAWASGTGATDTIASGEWSTAAVVAEDGFDVTPGAPSGTKTGEGTYIGGDGTVFSYLQVTVNALPADAHGQNLLYRISGETNWLIAGQYTNTSALTGVKLHGLIPGAVYELGLQAWSRFEVLSSVVIIGSTTYTAPNRTATPTAPSGHGLTQVGIQPKFNPGTSVLLYGTRVYWAANTDADFDHYELKSTFTNSSSATDYQWTPADGSGDGILITTLNTGCLYSATLNAGYTFVRSVNRSGVASAWTYIGNANSYATIGIGNMATQEPSEVTVTGIQIGTGSSVRQVLARYQVAATLTALGGDWEEAFNINLTNRGFATAPDVVIVGVASSLVGGYYDEAASSSTNAVIQLFSLDGTTLLVTDDTYDVMIELIEYY